ncbi:MAG: RES domain-containing protein, partial [Mesorhizobium sp.]
MTVAAVTYSGRLYRALNPVYAREPMSGRGAELYGGRFNPKGMRALYAS